MPRLAQSPAIDQAHRCRGIQFSLHDIPRSFATLWIPSPSDAVLTAAYSSLSADDNATTCCFLVHTLRQRLPLMMTPAETDRRGALSPPQSASESASKSPLCCQRNQHFALGLPTKYLPILLTHSLAFIPPCRIAWSRRVVRSFQLEALHYLSDMPLICLNCDSVTVPFSDAVEYSPALLEIWVSPST